MGKNEREERNKQIMINPDRLAETFKTFVEIDSVSKEEGALATELIKMFRSLGAVVIIDDADKIVGGDTGNIIAKFKGNMEGPALLLSGHMDTVEPGRGVKAILKDGVFTSDGTTILGADDKSALAILVEVLQVIRENHIPHAPLEIVLTICEEIGLLGAKNIFFQMLESEIGYVLDARDTEGLITKAPAANHLKIAIHGKDAHAGIEPETGINAIQVASQAIASLRLGRIDDQTTCNIGVIRGGMASNIVPNRVDIEGEVRSHDPGKLEEVTEAMARIFREAVEKAKKQPEASLPAVTVNVCEEFPGKSIPDDHPVVRIACKAADQLGFRLTPCMSGGGSDASVFCKHGIMTAVLGTGMTDMHSVRESVRVEDMVHTAELVLEIIRIHSETGGQLP
jgi:tripeptide aminopeptidase